MINKETQLTDRESEVLALLCQGYSLKLIAHKLLVTRSTAKSHSDRMRKKLGAHNQAEACALGVATGLVDPSTIKQEES